MEFRLYSFTNYYLSDIQKGIQTGHAAVDFVREHQVFSTDAQQWADVDKTFIVLNGGNNASMLEIADIAKKSNLMTTCFREDEQSLGGILTCVVVLVPDMYYDAIYNRIDNVIELPNGTILIGSEAVRYEALSNGVIIINDPLFQMIKTIKTAKLA